MKPAKPQSTLNEITNKVFTELLQQKVETHAKIAHKSCSTLTADDAQPSYKLNADGDEDDWCSQANANNFSQLKHVDHRAKPTVMSRHRKYAASPSAAKMASADKMEAGDEASKKPLIAVWKTVAKLQNTSTSGTPASSESHGKPKVDAEIRLAGADDSFLCRLTRRTEESAAISPGRSARD